MTTEKQNLEKRLREQSGDGSDVHNSNCCLEMTQLKEEIEVILTNKKKLSYFNTYTVFQKIKVYFLHNLGVAESVTTSGRGTN